MTEPDETAVALARLRATRTAPVPAEARAAASRRASRLGRRLLQTGRGESVLAWDDGALPEADDSWSTHRLTSVPVRTFAACLALCWPDPNEDPHPGRATTVDDVAAALAANGVDTRHGRGALRGELAVAGLVHVDGHTVRLGPAVASWSPSHVAALRRLHARLPRPPAASTPGDAIPDRVDEQPDGPSPDRVDEQPDQPTPDRADDDEEAGEP